MEDITEVRHAMYQRGFPVIPVSGKRPPMDEWEKLSANSDAIALWPNLYPFARNTGVLTKYFPTIDVDILNKEAAEAIEALARSRFEEHGTFAVRVGLWPKRAFLFRTDKPFKILNLKLIALNGKGEKIQILGNGQQVVVHGIHPDTKKPYSWTAGTPWTDICAKDLPYLDEAMAREFLRDALELLTTEYGYKLQEEPRAANGGDGAPRGSANWAKLFANIYTGADFHDATRDLAMSFAGVGMSRAAAVMRLRGAMDESQAPRDKRWQDRYDDIPRQVDTAYDKLGLQLEQEQLAAAAEAAAGRGAAVGEQEAAAEQPEQPPPKQPDFPAACWHGEVNPIDSRPCLVEDLIPEEGAGLISGQWGTLKTFNALELASCVMTGRSYLGFEIRRPGGVLFFALEGASEIAIRLHGVLEHKGSKRFERAPFAWYTSLPVRLSDPRAADAIIRMAEPIAARLKAEFGVPLALIIIDTVVAGADYQREGQDNDTAITHRNMMAMAKAARALHCFIFGIDHYGKDANVGTRGASVKEGDADVILACLADKNEAGAVSNHRLALRKRRSGANGEEFPFRTRIVEVGTNKFGKPETTLVIDYGEDPDAPPKPAKDDDWGKTKPAQHLRKVIMALMVEHGVDIRPFPDGKPLRALKLELVEAEFRRSYPVSGKSSDTKEQALNTRLRAFKRAVEDAVIKKGVIVTREIHDVQWVWLASHSPSEDTGPTKNA